MASSEAFSGSIVEIAVACSGLLERGGGRNGHRGGSGGYTGNSSHSSLVCILYVRQRDGRHWKEVGRTEPASGQGGHGGPGLQSDWDKTFQLEYFFEEKQYLRFSIFDWTHGETEDPYAQELLGSCECSLAEVVAQPHLATRGRMERPLVPYARRPGDCGLIYIYSEEQTQIKDVVTFQISGSNLDKCDVFSESDPFFTVNKTNPDGTDTLVYRSDYIKDNPNPDWPSVKMSSKKLCNGDYDRPLKIQVFDFDNDGKHDFIGEFYTTVNEMVEGEGFQIVLWDVVNDKKREKKSSQGIEYINSGQCILKSIHLDQVTTFLDYIRGGVKLHLVAAIDFTTSNGKPTDPHSLHHYNPQGTSSHENPYTMAIRTIGDIFQDYVSDVDKRFLALGFGGHVNGKTSHCFPLNGNSRDPYCYGIEGIVDAYYSSLEHVPLSDPACFAPVIKYVKSIAEKMNQDAVVNNYVVLLIITDGGITDMDETRKLLVDASNFGYPMSVVLVGVAPKGKNVRNLNILDGDSRQLTYRNQKARRDIVQFVEMARYTPEGQMDQVTFASVMREAGHAKFMLAKDLLAEVPVQVVEYMRENNVQPNPGPAAQRRGQASVRSTAMTFEDMRLGP